MIFLLLIFFIVAGKWRPDEDFLPLKLPTADAQQQALAKPEPLEICIFNTETGCRVQIGQRPRRNYLRKGGKMGAFGKNIQYVVWGWIYRYNLPNDRIIALWEL